MNVSLVVPTYNRATLIGATLDSALRQSVPFHEIIVIDDGSTDDTESVVRGVGAGIRYHRVPNGGVTAARALGASYATGTHLAFLDSDDLLDPTYVETHVANLRAEPGASLSICNFRWLIDGMPSSRTKHDEAPPGYWPAGRPIDQHSFVVPEPLYGRLLRWQPLFVGSFVVARAAYHEIGGYDASKSRWASEDFEFALRLAHLAPCCVCRLPLMSYRRHGAQLTENQAHWMGGDIAILRHSLAHHTLGARHREVIEEQVSLRSADLFDLAFAKRDAAAIREHWRSVAGPQRTFRRWIKRLVPLR